MTGRRVVVAGLLLLGATALAIVLWPRAYFPPDVPERLERVDAWMQAVMASRPAPGMAVGVVRGESLVLAKGYGVQHLERGGPVGADTVFHTASVSKTLVALAVMQLVEGGSVELDAPASRYLPYFRPAETPGITVGQLLTHTSGLPTDVAGGAWWENPQADEGALERHVRNVSDWTLVAAPGDGWHYSNAGYEVLGDLIAKVSGESFEDVMARRVLRPLGMTSSSFLPSTVPRERLAWPHRGNLMPVVSEVYPWHRAHAPSSTLTSSVQDLGRWLAAQLGRGRVGGTPILGAATTERMWEPQADIEDSGMQMTTGWFLRSHRGSRMLVHAGRDPGFNTCVAFLPDGGVGVVLLSNYDGQSAFELVEVVDGLLDIGQGREPVMPKASILIPLARILASDGVAAVIEEFPRLRADGRYSYTSSDLSTLGHELRRQDRLEEAIRLYEFNAAEHPDYFAPHLFLAETWLKLGDEGRALEAYRRGLACDPEGRWGFPLSEYRIARLEALMQEAGPAGGGP